MEGGAVGHNFERDTPRDHLCPFEPYIDASCQVWLHLAKMFQRRRFFLTLANQKKVLVLAAMFVGRMEPNEEALQRILHRCFLPSLVPFYQAVSEEQIYFKQQPIRNKNCPWWPHLLVERNEMKKLYRGPYIDAYCQVWFHLAKLFQRRRLRYEKVNRRMTSDGNTSHGPLGQES